MSAAVASPLLPVYPPAPVTFVDGDGLWLVDDAGRRYLDFGAGIAVVGLGHRHPGPLGAAQSQLNRLWHASNLFATEPAAALAAHLSDRSGGAQAFFCNSGTEAVEAALKYARKATGKPGVVALEGSFHGRTLGALSATGQTAKRAAFEPLLPHVREQRVVDRIHDRAGRSARDGVAAEGRAVVTWHERAGGLAGDEQAADRQAVREPFCERDEVRPDAELLEGEERTRAADAGLDLVEAE